MTFPKKTRWFTTALIAAAVAAPVSAMAQDADPEQAEQRAAEREAAAAERAAARAQREQVRREATEAERAAAQMAQEAAVAGQEAAQEATVRALRLFQDQGPNVWRVAPAQIQTEPQTYLGVSTRPLTPEVAAHVGDMPAGVGLIVSFVDEEGPAGTAGLQQHDVLVKLDDQWLINPEQFSVLVRMREAGDSATLTVFRKGEEQEIEVELAEKELPVQRFDRALQLQGFQGQLAPMAVPGQPAPMVAPMAIPGFQGMDEARRVEIEAKIQEAMKQLEGQNLPEMEQRMAELRETLLGRQLDLERLGRDMVQPRMLERGLTEGARLMINNDEMSLTMLNNDGEIHVTVTDADGEEVYEGPFPTDEQMEELSDEAQEILEQARKHLPRENPEPRRRVPAEAEQADEPEEPGRERVKA